MAELNTRQKALQKVFIPGDVSTMSDSDFNNAVKQNPANAKIRAEQLKRRKRLMEQKLLGSGEVQ